MRDLMLLKELKFFLENPYKEVYLRELAKKTKLSPYAAKKYADLLVKEGLIKDERRANLRYFKANTGNLFFRRLKMAFSINTLAKSGLVDHLMSNVANVSSVVLFGSMAKGEDDEKSDADILVIGKEKGKHVTMREIEEKLNKEVNLHVFSWSEWNKQAKSNKAFYFEIISHGIPLYGELPIVQ